MKKITAALLAFAAAVAPSLAATRSSLSSADRLRRRFDGSAAALNRLFDNFDAKGVPDDVIADILPSPEGRTQDDLRKMYLLQLDEIKLNFMTKYGPGILKRETIGWDLEAEIAKAQKAVQDNPRITPAQYREILREFFNSPKDYHVSVRFDATRASTLPFKVFSAQGRYFVAAIDDGADLPFHVGDEIIAFGGRPIADAIKQIKTELGNNKDSTDETLATMVLTSRREASFGHSEGGDDADTGVMVTVMPKGGSQEVAMEIPWQLTEEEFPDAKPRAVARRPYPGPYKMLSPIVTLLPKSGVSGNRFGLGDRDGFLPPLGSEILWKSPDNAYFRSYIYKLADGRPIGYVRIPSFDYDNDEDYDKAVAEFAGLMNAFDRGTDGLVIDQLHNPGGSIFYMYALASMLTRGDGERDWFAVPQHRIAINDDDVKTARAFIRSAQGVRNTEDAQRALGGATLSGYPVDDQLFQFTLDYSQFLVAQAQSGKTLTDPIFLEGVHKIRPSSAAHYTKPILMLIDEADFSCGDFFPSILQDNHRAVLFGLGTSGAGGFVNSVDMHGVNGVDSFSMTGSFALRPDRSTPERGTPLENRGVTPDLGYRNEFVADDAQNNYRSYAAKVNAAIGGLAEKPAAKAAAPSGGFGF